jgi:hypothetical protein
MLDASIVRCHESDVLTHAPHQMIPVRFVSPHRWDLHYKISGYRRDKFVLVDPQVTRLVTTCLHQVSPCAPSR